MRTNTIVSKGTVDTERYADKNTRPLRFNEVALQHVREVLTKMYGNAPLAVFREVLTNALDAHRAAGTTRPVEVTLPNENNGWMLLIQDWGVGMSCEDVDDIYADYGGSTKRDSNNEHGGYGMGAKAALAIADSFHVETIKNGTLTRFHMGSIDEKDTSGVFSLTFDSVEPTDRPNGTTVAIPYPANTRINSENPSDELQQLLFVLPPEKVIIDGKAWDKNLHSEHYTTVQNVYGETDLWYPTILKTGKTSPLNNLLHRDDTPKFNILLGDIPYPVTVANILNNLPGSEETFQEELNILRKLTGITGVEGMSVYAKLPIGTILPTPSRESIAYTPQAVETILNTVRETWERVVADLKQRINALDTRKNVIQFVRQWATILAGKELTWQGETIPTRFTPNEGDWPTLIITKGALDKKATVNPTVLKDLDPYYTAHSMSVYVTYGDKIKTSADLWAWGEKVRRRWASVIELKTTTLDAIYVVPEHVMKNKWWNWQENFNQWGTLEEIYEDVLKRARESKAKPRQKAGTDNLPYPIITLETHGKGEEAKTILRKTYITPDDPRLQKPILYITESHGLGYSVYMNSASQVINQNHVAWWEFYQETFGETHTLLFLTNRQRVETFLKKFPDANEFRGKMLTKLENFIPQTPEVGRMDILGPLHYSTASTVKKIISSYETLLEKELIEQNPVLETAQHLLTAEVDEDKFTREMKLAKKYCTIEWSSKIRNTVKECVELIEELSEQYKFFGGVVSLPGALESNIETVVFAYKNAAGK